MSDIGILVPLIGVSIPVVAIIGNVIVKPWLKLKERQLEVASHHAAEEAARHTARNDRLEQRVAVLERILTDRSAHLSDEIESLRDKPLN